MRHDGCFRRFSGTHRHSIELINPIHAAEFDNVRELGNYLEKVQRNRQRLSQHIEQDGNVVVFPRDDFPYSFFIDIYDGRDYWNTITVCCMVKTKFFRELCQLMKPSVMYFLAFGNVNEVTIEANDSKHHIYIAEAFDKHFPNGLPDEDVQEVSNEILKFSEPL